MEKEEKAMNIGVLLSSSPVLSVSVVILMLILFLILAIFIACKFKPWRRFLSSSSYPHHRSRALLTSKDDDIERPLVSEDLGIVEDVSSESAISYSIEGAGRQAQGSVSLPHSVTVAPKRALSTSPQLMHSDSFVLDIQDSLEDSSVGRTLKRPIPANHFAEEQIHEEREDSNYNSNPNYTAGQRNILMLEVIAGPSRGVSYSVQSTDASKLPVTIGRVSPGDILLKDSEVSGKHAMINWNVNKLKWELVDMGSLNGTLLNSQIVHHHQSGSRHWGNPVELSSGDVITFGTSSKISVQIVAATERQIPFGIGVAADAMSMRRGAKKLPMEDVCYYQWPLTGTNEFGVFGICDGHGGADAATSASKIMPEVIAEILSDSFRRKRVLTQCDASDVLREAFARTEERITHYYEMEIEAKMQEYGEQSKIRLGVSAQSS